MRIMNNIKKNSVIRNIIGLNQEEIHDIYGSILETYVLSSTHSNLPTTGATVSVTNNGVAGFEYYIFTGTTSAIGSNITKTTITTSGTAASATDTISAFDTKDAGAHTHSVTINNNQTAKVKIGSTQYNTLQLNTASTQSTVSVVSKHYKLAYIQRIY